MLRAGCALTLTPAHCCGLFDSFRKCADIFPSNPYHTRHSFLYQISYAGRSGMTHTLLMPYNELSRF
ncbi:hypothetical protein CF57_15560 [Escherichia coli]|nr:hypothetical protein BU34_27080 [Escherichia coli]AHM34724.1 hypothetical protein CF57_15560 [Escherichia coli]AHM39322.1 hypothetical protein CF61_16295 [Escherichia coli]EFK15675.1 hypothetical protein HMPREF9541_01959 [Escherichia coli MS 116-1]ESD99091.1 hypothetical protein HMPREF1616_04612 [Escherichia coli 908658]